MAFGVLTTGFAGKSITDILDEIEASERAAFGSQINTGADSVFGQLNGTVAAQLAELWELAEAVYASSNPDQATGAALDAVSAITGSTRSPATKSTVTLSVNLAAGVQLLAGRIVSDVFGNRFVTTAFVENTAAYPQNLSVAAEAEEFGPTFVAAHQLVNIETPVAGWAETAAFSGTNAEPFVIGAGATLLMTVDGSGAGVVSFVGTETTAALVAAKINTDTTGLTASDAGGFVRITSDNPDGEVSSLLVNSGTAVPILGFPTDLVAGTNPEDTTTGEDLETDAEFRLSREAALRAQGEATVEAILADMLPVTGVVDAVVYENTTEFVDGAGRGPHSVEVIILGTDPDTDLDDRVGAALFATKAAGVESYRVAGGDGRTITVTDSQGIDHDINFNRAEVVDIYVTIDVDVVSGDYAGDDALKTAIVAQGADYQIGDDVVAEANKAAAFAVNGVYDVTDYRIGVAPAPAGTVNIVIDIREIGEFDTSRVVVNSTPVVPS